MATFENMKDLEKYLLDKVSKSMKDVGDMADDIVKEKLDELIYGAYEPSWYQRTEQLRDSVTYTTKEEGNSAVLDIFNDIDKIHAIAEGNQHYSIWPYDKSGRQYDPDVSEQLPMWIEQGQIGEILGNGPWTHPRPFMRLSKEQIEKDELHVKILKRSLQQEGLDVE